MPDHHGVRLAPRAVQAFLPILSSLCLLLAIISQASAGEVKAAAAFRKEVQPILREHCYDCHGDGMNKGKVSLDEFESDEALLKNHDLWWRVLKNVRAGIMPPEKKARLSAQELRQLEDWIKREAFGIDPKHPDPGRVTLRRLNRVEYRNTIRDLTGHEYKVEEELPPDDTGYGFDNIGDVLSISPLLLEKYMQAAETIVTAAVPRVAKVVEEKTVPGSSFRKADEPTGKGKEKHSFYDETKLSHVFTAKHSGSYRLALELEVAGQFDFDPGRCRVVFKADAGQLWEQEFGWQNNKKFKFEFDEKWEAGEHPLELELHPLTPVEKKKNSLDLRITAVRIQGPLEKEHWVRPKNFDHFFTKDVPAKQSERRKYAREILARFASKAFRRPVDARTVERLAAIAESVSKEPGKRFEDGIAQAVIPVLASPRFLFRVEEADSSLWSKSFSNVDEPALASRLSYFLWSSMPDDQLFRLAERRGLRKNLRAEVKRMLADPKSQALVDNFTGQWLQVRDVDGIDINARAVLARDGGEERRMEGTRRRFQELRDIPEEKLTAEQKKELEALRASFRRRFARPTVELDGPLRKAMKQETEMLFAHILRQDRSALELIDCDYTFLNERLAKHYGLTNLNVTGTEMRLVSLPENSPRGGLLTHGSVLVVTSNPTRTSPVKRGLFVLDNVLGLPPPPPPADIPLLEESEKEFKGKQPTLRQVLEIHREKPLCASCHNRMDPLGLALENFNALGMWREMERGQPIEAAGKLITGESFQDIREVKRVLATKHRRDFYRCLTEKLLTYALGRGLEYYDVETVDQIVARLEHEDGRFSALLMGVVESAPFQKRRNPNAPVDPGESRPLEQRAEVKLQP
ncbi:MAG: DUF1592 domain-containing protein [Verrucomicrobiales bacterium]|nr:DUF1592 domain-containing protein [Verrucomicrobiales bacterium]